MRCSSLYAASAISATATAFHGGFSFDNLVTFGDSYTDDGRLVYYATHNGSGPPAGVLPPQSSVSASGGLAWGQYVQQDTGVAYFDYAVSGATCSNEIVSRYFSYINAPFPSVVDDELPSFVADVEVKALYENRTAENTVYALWIGTNDLGYGAFLTDSQAPGVSDPVAGLCVTGFRGLTVTRPTSPLTLTASGPSSTQSTQPVGDASSCSTQHRCSWHPCTRRRATAAPATTSIGRTRLCTTRPSTSTRCSSTRSW